jgi:long-chain-alcohol oxidase
MELTERQRASLQQICDTFAPGDGRDVPPASQLGADQVVAELAGANPRASEVKQLTQLLGLWDSRLIGLVGGAKGRPFSKLSQTQREQVLLSFGDSGLAAKRALFLALRTAAMVAYYGTAGPTGHSPVWDSIAYPGPLGPLATAPPRELSPIRPAADTTLDCDVVIVGSGAGGGTAAGVLSAAGLDVIVLEAGDYYDDRDFDGGELGAITRLYAAAPGVTAEGQVNLVAGSCLGGGTVVNYSTSFRTPEEVRAEWAAAGTPAFTTDDYGASLDAVCERLGVNLEHHTAAARDAVMERGLRELGWHVDAMPRNVRGCDMGIDCGRCGFGCRLGAKQSVAKTWLKDAATAGARLVVGVRTETIKHGNGKATGVSGTSASGHKVTVNAKAVVVACGAIQTPALLGRSKLGNAHVGQHLHLHPVTVLSALMDEEVRGWEGSMQSRYSREHADLDGEGYGVIYETGPMNPSLVLPFIPWRSGQAHLERMQEMPQMTVIGVILRDKDGGQVKVRKDGHPTVHYKLSPRDIAHLKTGIDGASQILEQAGARRITSSHTKLIEYEPGRSGSREQFIDACNAEGYAPGRCTFGSFHIMGSARMGGSPKTSATNPQGALWDTPNVIVADGSSFPSASGVNPMISIESIAHMNARNLAAALS